MNSDTDPHELGPDSERTDPDAPTPMRQLLDELVLVRRAAETAADSGLDCQARLSRVEGQVRSIRRERVDLPWAALAVAILALALSVACVAVVR